jgi:hypothetical protein
MLIQLVSIAMEIEFLYFEDCPSHEVALSRLQLVMDELGVKEDVRVIRVNTEREALAQRFVGSPTIRINGTDIVPQSTDEPYRLACRIYHLEDGRISPLPSENMIRKGLQREI